MSHLDKHLPAGNPVVNAQPIRRNLILANTRLGAVLVQRGFWSGVHHVFLEVPSQKTAFRCSKCQENLQFYNLDIPNDVYCSICAAKYHVDRNGQVSDDQDVAVPAEFKPKQLHPFPPTDLAGSVRDRTSALTRASEAAEAASTEPARRSRSSSAAAFRHNGFTLYARKTVTKGGARTLFFFAKGAPKSGEPSPLPDGYVVGANGRTGLPYLKRAAVDTEVVPAEPAAQPARTLRNARKAVASSRRPKRKSPKRRA